MSKWKCSNWKDFIPYKGSIFIPYALPRQGRELDGNSIPNEMFLSLREQSGFFLGLSSEMDCRDFVGIPIGMEGNVMVVGGNGSGKSAGIAKPTLRTWQGAICVTDIKGELSDFYAELYHHGLVNRPYIIFDPMQIDGPSYDPFWLLAHDSADNLVNNVKEIAAAIAPVLPDDKQPFWAETEQGVLAAALLYYIKIGLNFSETVCAILSSSMTGLCEKLVQNGDVCVKMLLGEAADMKPETLANFDRGLRNKIMLFATDPYISHAFRGQREGATVFTWDDLNRYNIFLRIPADKIEQWGGAINLMYTQLIRHLERRPEMYIPEGEGNIQTLLLMDEFARFGKREMITSAISTLRSKNVNICLMVQSVAQLDKIYGEYDRRIIFDNCQFLEILRANDADTQRYLCELIGTHIRTQRSVSELMDEDEDTTGYSRQISETRDWIIQPHELATLQDALLLTPYGFYRAVKFRLYDEQMKSMLLAEPDTIIVPCEVIDDSEDTEGLPYCLSYSYTAPEETCDNFTNKGAKIMSIEERTTNANRKAAAAEQKKRREERAAQDALRKKDRLRNCIVGELVARYFPDIRNIEPGTDIENQPRFDSLEAFLHILSTDHDLVEELQERAAKLMEEDPDAEWRMPM